MTRVAVIDVETTGLNPYRNHRIVEIAALVVELNGRILRELVTLVNPERDMGPTRIHGLSTEDVFDAPRFNEVAPQLLELLDGCVAIAGHNVRFDQSFLAVEFDRVGCPLPEVRTLCTMQLAGGGSLSCVCAEYGIAIEGDAHSAWNDAFATANLLRVLLKDAPLLASDISSQLPIAWPRLPKLPLEICKRGDVRRRYAHPPTYIQQLLMRAGPQRLVDDESSAILAYAALLDQVLEDRVVEAAEGESLIELANSWGISGAQLRRAHWDYLTRLASVAVADGVLSNAERRDLERVAALLAVGAEELEGILELAARQVTGSESNVALPAQAMDAEDFTGKRVCFTGESQCTLNGEVISRAMAAALAEHYGMIVAESVTKKLDLLVVADPLTQSGKAKKARQYGIRIIAEPVEILSIVVDGNS